MSDKLTEEWSKLDSKVRFITAVIRGDIVINNRRRKDIIADLRAKNFKPFPTKPSKQTAEEDGDSQEMTTDGASDYDYLLRMPLWNLTMEKVNICYDAMTSFFRSKS